MSSIAASRVESALREALGADVARLLKEPGVTDVMLNEDGLVWVDSVGTGRRCSGIRVGQRQASVVLKMLADCCGVPLTRESPILSATIPNSGERVAGTGPPVTMSYTFAIRKPPETVFSLEAFSDDAEVLDKLRGAVSGKRNILISGSTGSGKSSLLSAIVNTGMIAEDRVLCLEDTQEVNLTEVPDHLRLLTSPSVSMRDLVMLSLRLRPDRIIVGELRSGSAALEWINACNTGHGGSLATIHADSASDSIGRLEDLCNQVAAQTPTRAIQHAIGCMIFVSKVNGDRKIREVILR